MKIARHAYEAERPSSAAVFSQAALLNNRAQLNSQSSLRKYRRLERLVVWLLVNAALVFQPSIFVATVRIIVRPMDHATLRVPFVLTKILYRISFSY